jgi:type IV secretory pathway VirJ component
MKMSCCALLLLLLAPVAGRAMMEDTLRVAPFGKVTVYRQTPNPAHVVLFVSGDGGWNLGVVDMARTLAGLDALVAGVDIVHYLRQLDQSSQACSYPAADFEMLSQTLQRRYEYPTYTTPILVGYSSGATLVYATLVQAPSTTFAGGVSLGFCPDLEVHKPFCRGNGLEFRTLPKGHGLWFLPASNLDVPWIALQGTIDQVCFPDSTITYLKQVRNGQLVLLPKVGHGYAVYANWMPQFKEAFHKLSGTPPADTAAAQVPELPDLPLEVVDASGTPTDMMALHITGDGGWGVTDKGLGQDLAAKGVPVVALNALHYFWKERTPDQTAQDVVQILRFYLNTWKKDKIILTGYSFGADVLPFVVSRLPQDLRSKVKIVVFVGLSKDASFHFQPTNWLGGSGKNALPTEPEIQKLEGLPMLCFYGTKDSGTLCADLPSTLVHPVEMSGGHRVGGNYDMIVDEILKGMQGE